MNIDKSIIRTMIKYYYNMKINEIEYYYDLASKSKYNYYLDENVVKNVSNYLFNYYTNDLDNKIELSFDEICFLNSYYRLKLGKKNLYDRRGNVIDSLVCTTIPIVGKNSLSCDYYIYASLDGTIFYDERVINALHGNNLNLRSFNEYLKKINYEGDTSYLKECIFINNLDRFVRSSLFYLIALKIMGKSSDISSNYNLACDFIKDINTRYNLKLDIACLTIIYNKIMDCINIKNNFLSKRKSRLKKI